MLLVCSLFRKDSCPQARAYQDKALQLGGTSVNVMPVNLNHGQINAQVGQANGYTENIDQFLMQAGIFSSRGP
jgi:hypothetical protein